MRCHRAVEWALYPRAVEWALYLRAVEWAVYITVAYGMS